MNLPCIFPGGHEIRAKIQCSNRKVVCLFKQETSEGAKWPLWKRGRNPTTRHTNIETYIATIASLWSEGPRPYLFLIYLLFVYGNLLCFLAMGVTVRCSSTVHFQLFPDAQGLF